MPEITVNGKKVVIREHFPAREFWGLADEWRRITDETPYEDLARAVSRIVVSWEFEGDPSAPDSWGNLDTWLEFQPLIIHIGGIVRDRIAQAKNAVGPPS
jgi:hypothetical protein